MERAVFTGLGAFVSAALLNTHELVANLNLIIDNLSEECFSRYDTVETFRGFPYFCNEKMRRIYGILFCNEKIIVVFMACYFCNEKIIVAFMLHYFYNNL